MKSVRHVVDHRLRDARVEADPENVVHYKVGILQLANHAPLYVAIGRLPKQIAAEKQAGGFVLRFHKTPDLFAGWGCVPANPKREPEAAWVRTSGGLLPVEEEVEVPDG